MAVFKPPFSRNSHSIKNIGIISYNNKKNFELLIAVIRPMKNMAPEV
jgi:hypothetical protein